MEIGSNLAFVIATALIAATYLIARWITRPRPHVPEQQQIDAAVALAVAKAMRPSANNTRPAEPSRMVN
ncbi:MAG TPA: hypothetical protein VF082_12805 [Jiangellaceae bacterium]